MDCDAGLLATSRARLPHSARRSTPRTSATRERTSSWAGRWSGRAELLKRWRPFSRHYAVIRTARTSTRTARSCTKRWPMHGRPRVVRTALAPTIGWSRTRGRTGIRPPRRAPSAPEDAWRRDAEHEKKVARFVAKVRLWVEA